MVQYPKINTYVHKKNFNTLSIGWWFCPFKTNNVDEKRESFYVAFIQKKHILVQKIIILVNWKVFFSFQALQCGWKTKRIIPWFTHPKENFIHAPNISICYSQLLHGDFTCQVQQCGQKTKKIIQWVHPFQRKAHPYTKTY